MPPKLERGPAQLVRDLARLLGGRGVDLGALAAGPACGGSRRPVQDQPAAASARPRCCRARRASDTTARRRRGTCRRDARWCPSACRQDHRASASSQGASRWSADRERVPAERRCRDVASDHGGAGVGDDQLANSPPPRHAREYSPTRSRSGWSGRRTATTWHPQPSAGPTRRARPSRSRRRRGSPVEGSGCDFGALPDQLQGGQIAAELHADGGAPPAHPAARRRSDAR